MGLQTPFNYEQLVQEIRTVLLAATTLAYVPRDSVIIGNAGEAPTDPMTIDIFKSYLIKLVAPESGFEKKVPHIGQYYRNYYSVGVDLWIKSSGKLAERLLQGRMNVNKGIFEFFQDVSDVLEHNRLNNKLNPYPGTNISDSVPLTHANQMITGVGFFWYGAQDNLK